MTDLEDKERKMRAEKRRRNMTVRFTTLDDETDPWPVFGLEAMSLASQITRQVWEIAGLPIPNYRRSEIPIRFSDFDPE